VDDGPAPMYGLADMRSWSLPAAALAVSLACGCQCPEAEILRYAQFDLATPDGALAYFQEALIRGDARQEYLLFSEELKERVEREEGHRLSLSNYTLARDDIRGIVERRAGRIEEIEIDEPVHLSPGRATVDIWTRAARATVVMTLEVSYGVQLADGTELSGFLPASEHQGRLVDRALVLEFALPPATEGGPPADVHRISYFRDWKIADIEGGLFVRNVADEIGERLRQEEEERRKRDTERPPPE